MSSLAEDVLRGRGRFRAGGGRVPWRALTACVAAFGAIYGAVMGCFGLTPLQAVYSAIKVPMLIVVSTLVCLPSFAVASTIMGLRSDLEASCRAILAAQATVCITLASLAPVTAFVYSSIDRYSIAVMWNGIPFLIATLAGQTTLRAHYATLERSNPRHRLLRHLWMTLYVFVAIQLAWVLRPFVGTPDRPTLFFREEAWSNAYVVVTSTLGRILSGR